MLTLIVPIEKDLSQLIPIESLLSDEHLIHKGEQMYEHIAYCYRHKLTGLINAPRVSWA